MNKLGIPYGWKSWKPPLGSKGYIGGATSEGFSASTKTAVSWRSISVRVALYWYAQRPQATALSDYGVSKLAVLCDVNSPMNKSLPVLHAST